MNRSNRNNVITLLAALLLFSLASGFPLTGQARQVPRHDITVALDPDRHTLAATDTVTIPKSFPRSFVFALHAGLRPRANDPGVRIEKGEDRPGAVPLETFRVTLPPDASRFSVSYEGGIYHPVITGKNQARGIDQTPGSISAEGVYLAGSSAWYPLLPADFMTFALTIELPQKWDAVSQGGRTVHEKTSTRTKVGWDSPEPQNEIYLVASPFTDYEKKGERIAAQVYLREPDEALANKYLDATLRYITMYDALIGAYPYKKFALVENFWETGFGMPSFTLLGPTVLRLPFIINTSYPHEILHNWWGNSVYPDYEKGNWSEGLTAYLADHLLKEQQGGGADYRLNTLQKYADYVLTGRDFPLTRFTSRHSPSTEAVGYGKALMFFHMLRLEIGDKTFIDGIRDFYQTCKFRYATFDDIEKSFEKVSGRKLGTEFEQWVTRTGAPSIRLRQTRTASKDGKHLVRATLEQVQSGRPYRLRIPVAVTMEGQEQAYQTIIEMTQKRQEIMLTVPSRPLRLDIDPEFDVFRRLDRGEIPPAITQVLGAQEVLVVLPSKAPREVLNGYRQFAESLSNAGPDRVDLELDTNVKKLPVDRAVVILGWENSFFEETSSDWSRYDIAVSSDNIRIGKTTFPKADHSVVLTARNSRSKENGIMFIAADGPRPLPGLARKLPHYHKYSYLVFEGDEPANVGKGRWPVVDSPLTACFKDKDGKASRADLAQLQSRPALAPLPPIYSKERMMETVKYLASSGLRGREIGTPGIDQAAEYIARSFKQAGLEPGGDDGTYFQKWTASDTRFKDGPQLALKNVIGVIPGKKQEFAGQSVVVGAHYDHLGTGEKMGRPGDKGKIHPGADDNASGVAVVLELASVMREAVRPDRAIVFAAFTGEEEGKLGSAYYARNEKRYPAARCIGMVNLDTVGRLDRKKLLVLGGSSAGEWVHIFRGAGFVTGVDIDMVTEDLDASDQMSFQAAGVPAVQLFSGPTLDYHRPTDTADKIDASGLVAVASVTREVVEYLADRADPLTSTLKAGEQPEPEQRTERKVTLGTIPDYSYKGKGVRLSGVAEDSPAAAAGLRQGDVLVRINETSIRGLKDFSDLLKTMRPGDRMAISFIRDGMERTVVTEARAR